MNKKIISGITAAAMSLNMVTIMPTNAFAAGEESRVYEKDGYTVIYTVGSEWENNRSVEVTIRNTGEETILNWALKYDVGGEVSNLWNSKVYDVTEDYAIIKNNGYNYEIEPGQTANYGYIVTGEETIIPEDIELCSRRIDVKSGYEVDFNITNDWYTGFQAEVSIENTSTEPIEAWTLLFDGNFDINNVWNAKLLSSEDRSYEVANQLWTTPIKPGESASFGFTSNKSATENAKAENFRLTAVIVGESALEKEPVDPDDDIDFELDTDEDGLPDYYEEILGTDKNKADTDGDGLSDGYEVFYLGTDPLKADSDDNGVNDGNEDNDKDGLTNAKEQELGTDPNSDDTDRDGLSDGAEVNTHKTDPLKYDTDGDNISDGDEIALGLDPNSGSTNGTPDNERTFAQVVGADSEVLSAVNNDEETPFKVSLEMKAAGVAENNVYARESGYSNAIENSAIIGIAPEFVYTDGLAVEEVTVKFELDNSVINNTLGTYAKNNDEFKGIKRLNVFMFFEDVNMLLPVETFHDETTNTVYTKTDRVGTYCLMDMEIFFRNLGIEPSESADVEVSGAMSGNMIDSEGYLCYNVSESEARSNSSKYKDNFDVVFVIDQVNYNDDMLEIYCDKIIDTADAIWDVSPNVSITVYGLNGDGVTHYENYGCYNTPSGMKKALTKARKHINGVDTNLSVAVDNIAANYSNKKIYCFIFFDSFSNNYQTEERVGKSTLYGVKHGNLNIDISVISNIPDEKKHIADEVQKPYAAALFEMTNGIEITRDNFVNEALIHIYGEIPNVSTDYSMGVFATNWREVELEAPITKKYKENSERDYDKLDMSDLEGCADTDRDGLYDFQEILFYLYGDTMSFDEDGNVHLYSLNELSEKNDIFKKFPTYVEAFVDKIKEENYDEYIEFLGTPIVLLKSDPTNPDGDGDSFSDLYEINAGFNPLTYTEAIIVDSLIDDTMILSPLYNIPTNINNLQCNGKIKSYHFDVSTKSKCTICNPNIILDNAYIDKDKGLEDMYNQNVNYCAHKTYLEFYRTGNQNHYFSLKPICDSDYKLKISSPDPDYNMKILKNNNKFIESVDSNSNIYALSKGVNYTIVINSSSDFTFSIEQYNWIIAPMGGIQTYKKGLIEHNDVYVNEKTLSKLLGKYCPILDEDNDGEYEFTDLKSVYLAFYLIDLYSKNEEDTLRQWVGATTTIAGVLPIPAPYNLMVGCIGVLTLLNWEADTIEDTVKKAKIKDIKLFLVKRTGAFLGKSEWDVWLTPGYINRYIYTGYKKIRTEINEHPTMDELNEYIKVDNTYC